MPRKTLALIAFILALALFACDLSNPVALAPAPTDTTGAPGPTSAAPTAVGDTIAPLPSDTPLLPTSAAPSDTLAPAPASNVTPVPVPASSNFIDDRSTPSQVIVSLYNAISRNEYLRAYNYWDTPATTLGSFDAYANGYQNTASVNLVFGQIQGDESMSQLYYTVPVILKVTGKDATHSNFAACYLVHQALPDVFGAPPFAPMGINRGTAKVSALNADDASVLAGACSGFPSGPKAIPVAANPLNIDKSNFLDNRSGAVETVSSFLNALNLKQYVRAYSYFLDPATYPGTYAPWAAGYANTGAITVTFGTVQSDGAAGSIYYKVPLAMHVVTTSSAKQTFVGCFTLRQVQPAIQGAPPFQPIGIISGKFSQVSEGTDIVPLLAAACN